MIYTDSMAERMKERVGEKWQPSNGTEGDMFICAMCKGCANNQGENYDCEIALMTMCYSPDDDEYPKEWCIDEKGQPTCTAFKAARTDA